jgi:phosphatidylglycerol:prolipoprotein diacylglycerol transferase
LFPYFQFGPITLGVYGLLMTIAFLCAWKTLELNIYRHKLSTPRAEIVVLLLAGVGILGAKLYHELETPTKLFARPSLIFNLTQGYAWSGGLLASIVALYLLARHHKLPILTMMDLVSPAATLGYAIGRLGCLLAGDGCYGTQTSLPWGMAFPRGIVPTNDYVHPTPIYEFLIGIFVFLYLWHISARIRPVGLVFALYLLLTGAARFLIEAIRDNPRLVYGFTSAQLISLLCLIVGASVYMRVLLVRPRPDSITTTVKASDKHA